MTLRSLMTTALAVASAATLTLSLSSATAAAPTVRVYPGDLDRGANVRAPHAVGSTIIDGTRRIDVPWAHVRMLGRSGSAYLVHTSDRDYQRNRVLRVARDGTRTILLRGALATEAVLDASGARFATVLDERDGTTVAFRSATTGVVQHRRTFGLGVRVFDLDHGSALLSGWSTPRTQVWRPYDKAVDVLRKRPGQAGDLGADRFSYYTGDPYDGGCTVVAKISAPRTVLWRSCTERVETFAPGGARMATIHILSDGAGPNRIHLRRIRGRALAHYTPVIFGGTLWERDGAFVAEAHGPVNKAYVRCVGGSCVRASVMRPADLG